MSVFTKVWSVNDDGTILYGADLGEIQADLDELFNAGIVNAHIASNAGISESKIAFSNNAAGHAHDNSSTGGSYVVIPHYRYNCDVVWSSVSSVYAQPGVIEIGGKLLVRTTNSTTITDTSDSHWIDGSNAAGASTWYYVYAYNDSAVSWDIKFHESAPNAADTSGNTTGRLLYRQVSGVWYRCIMAVRNDSSSDIIKFYSKGDFVIYDAWTTVLSAGTQTSFTDIDCSSVIPVIAQRGLFILEATGTTLQSHLRPNGSSATDGNRYDSDDENTVEVWCNTDSAQVVEYKIVSGTSLDVHVKGYQMLL